MCTVKRRLSNEIVRMCLCTCVRGRDFLLANSNLACILSIPSGFVYTRLSSSVCLSHCDSRFIYRCSRKCSSVACWFSVFFNRWSEACCSRYATIRLFVRFLCLRHSISTKLEGNQPIGRFFSFSVSLENMCIVSVRVWAVWTKDSNK